jgi:hypothetical protein
MPDEYVESDVKEFIKRLPDLSVSPPTVHLVMLCVRSKKVKELLGYKLSDLVVERDIVRAIMTNPDTVGEQDEFNYGEIRATWRSRYFSKVTTWRSCNTMGSTMSRQRRSPYRGCRKRLWAS